MVPTLLLIASVALLLVLCGGRRRWKLRQPRRRWLWAAPVVLVGLAVASSPMILVQKALAGLLMPAGLIWLALLLAAVAALLRQQGDGDKRDRRMAVAACSLFAAYWLLGNGITAAALLGWHQRPFISAQLDHSEPFDALLVLGGASSRRPSGEVQLSPSGDRLVTAARLFHRGASRLIVCAGTPLVGGKAADEQSAAGEARRLLVELGVPSGAILVVPGRNTSEEISAFAQLSSQQGWQRKGLVTSAWHMRRASRLAQRAGVSVTPVPADFRGYTPTPTLLELIPSAESLWRVRLVSWEWLGMLVGR